MDLTVLHLAVPRISADLQPTSAELLWIIDIYGFLVAGSLITMGTLGDRIGRRRLLLIGATAFGIVSILAAFSTTPEMLIISRALMGVAGATIAPSTLSLIFNMFSDPRQRSKAIGVWITAFSAGGAIGPIVGGILLESYWWGSVFLLALPVMGLLLILGPKVLPEYRDPEAARLDLISAAMSLVAILLVIYGLKEMAQSGIGVTSMVTIGSGLVVGYLFHRRQRRLASPLIDIALFKSVTFNVSLFTNILAIFVAFGYFLFVAQYLQLVLGLTPLEAGLWSLPSAAGFIVGSNVAPRFVHRARPAIILGPALVLAALGLVLLTQTTTTSGLSVVVAGSVLISLALSPVFNLTTELIVGSAPPERAGVVSGISETGAEFGGALGIAVLGSIGTAVYRSGVARSLPSEVAADASAAVRDTLGAAMEVAQELPAALRETVLEVARTAFVDALHLTAIVAATIAGVAAIVVIAALRAMPGRDARPSGAPASQSSAV
jgi:DHA2 family multidrug resistance protein-like MFS transporter